MYAVTVTFRLYPAGVARFLDLVRKNAAASLADEPGCHRFDICLTADEPYEVFLYELYGSRADFDAHLASAHYHAFDAAAAECVRAKTIQLYEEVEA